MRSNPTAAWDKVPRNRYNLGTAQALKNAPRTDAIGKAAAHHDQRSLRKGRAWVCKPMPHGVPANRVKASKIDWA
jgi:hypothetical protein